MREFLELFGGTPIGFRQTYIASKVEFPSNPRPYRAALALFPLWEDQGP
jgi:hypothetical protein